MSFSDRRDAIPRTVARLGVLAALAAGVGGVAAATGTAAPPIPPPLPPPAVAPSTPAASDTSPVGVAVPAGPWDSIARCETGGDWHADTGNGYQGGLQLSPQTWMTHGGGQFAPRADQASREQQIVVADRVRAEEGWQAWSGCADEVAPR